MSILYHNVFSFFFGPMFRRKEGYFAMSMTVCESSVVSENLGREIIFFTKWKLGIDVI